MPKFQAQFADQKTGTISPTVQGLIVSSILLTASLASLASGPLSDRISRTRTIAVGAIVFAAGSTIACAAGTLAQLFVGRALAGVGEGLFISAVTVYAIEIAPASSRGRLGSVVQLLITIGIASGDYAIMHALSALQPRFLMTSLPQVTLSAMELLVSTPPSHGGSPSECRQWSQSS